MPGWKQLSESETRRMERIADEKINNSASFKTLSELCQKKIPPYSGFNYLSKSASWKGSDYLTYFYSSERSTNADWQNVKRFYRDYFLKGGWELTEEYDTNWGSSVLEHRNGRFVVRVYYRGLGTAADYAFHCGNLPELDENGKPRR